MAPQDPTDERPTKDVLAENEEVKEDEVLEREGVEQELMQRDDSDVGEEIEDVQDE